MFTTSLPTLVADSATVLTITSHKPTFTTTVPVYYCSNCTNSSIFSDCFELKLQRMRIFIDLRFRVIVRVSPRRIAPKR